jgi:hypothetical protein
VNVHDNMVYLIRQKITKAINKIPTEDRVAWGQLNHIDVKEIGEHVYRANAVFQKSVRGNTIPVRSIPLSWHVTVKGNTENNLVDLVFNPPLEDLN